MKKTLVLLLLAFSFAVNAQQGFTITAKIGLKHAAKAILNYKIGDQAFADTATVTNGMFSFKGSVVRPVTATIGMRFYALQGTDPRKPMAADILTFFIENQAISIVSADSVNNARITGSPVNDEYARLNAYISKANPKNAREQSALYADYARKNNNSFIGMYALSASLWRDVDENLSQQVFDQFTPEMRNSPYGKVIAALIQTMRNISPGAPAMDFTQNDASGKPVKLSDFKGKYVLVDFWASWCGPCRMENPNLVATFNQFKSKNFTVLGVSLDRVKENWLKAVKDDRLNWTQVSDLQYWDNTAAKLYAVKGIPFNVLVGPDGTILGKNLFGEALKRKLAETLK